MLNVQPVAPKRISELDGLRGIAILLVVFFHYINNQLIDATGGLGKMLYQLTSFGWAGVDLFFVLSGFLIGSVLLKNRNSSNYFSTFYIRRIVRIIPNYYLLIGLFFIIGAIPYFSRSYFLLGANVIPWWSYILMIHNIFMGRLDNLGANGVNVTWSIGIEEQFYLFFPLIVYFVRLKWLPYLLLLAIAGASIIRPQYAHWIPRYVYLPCRMDSIAFGALIAYFNEEFSLTQLFRDYKRSFMTVMILNLSICFYLFFRFRDLGVNKHFFLAIFFSGCLIMALTLKDSVYGALLRNKVLVWIGTVSYSLYLFHYMILGILQYVLLNHEGGVYIHDAKDLGISVFALGVSVLFAWFIYRKLETPFVTYGKKFNY